MRTRVYHYVGGGDEMRWVQETRRREKETMMIKRWSSVTLYTRDPIQYTAHYSIDNGRFEMKRSASGIVYRAVYRVERLKKVEWFIHSWQLRRKRYRHCYCVDTNVGMPWKGINLSSGVLYPTRTISCGNEWNQTVMCDVTWLVLHSDCWSPCLLSWYLPSRAYNSFQSNQNSHTILIPSSLYTQLLIQIKRIKIKWEKYTDLSLAQER